LAADLKSLINYFINAIGTEETYLINNNEEKPETIYLSTGPIEIVRTLSIPIKYGGQLLGIIGLMNKRTAYTETDSINLEPVINSCSVILNAFKIKNQRKELQKQLIQSQNDLEALITSLKDLVFEIDQNLIITKYWASDDNLLIIPAKEIIGKKITNLHEFPYLTELLYKIQLVKQTGEKQYLEYLLPLQGKEIWFQAQISLIKSKDLGERISLLIQDITKLKVSENETRNALEKEKELSQLKSRFVSMASHEFKTPLTCIKSSSEILRLYLENENLDKQKFEKHLKSIIREADQMTSLINEILVLGKTEAQMLQIKLSDCSLLEILNTVIERQELSNEIIKEITGCIRPVKVDRMKLEHILDNLISNAKKYTPSGKAPEVNITFLKKSFSVEVRDYGIGIPEKDQEQLFQSFYRATNTGHIEGNGLGLVLVKNFIQLHGGKIELFSKENQGTKIQFEIPG